jgi:adenylate cyclase class 2
MKTEIEVKFLDVDFNLMREKLTQLGAVCEQPMRLMRRAIIQPSELHAKHAFVRVRDEGDKVTLTYKQVDEDSLTGAKEIEVIVSNFEDTVALFEQAGLGYKSFQESRRETWQLDSVEVVLDEWPWLNPYVEIEGSSEADVKRVATELGFNWDNAVFGRVTSAYQIQYPEGDSHKLVTIPMVTFDQPVPAVISGRKDTIK